MRARLDTAVDQALTARRCRTCLEERQLVHDAMDASRVQRVREEMERAEARRLQPHYIESFFREAFRRLGGEARQREARRYQVTHVPALIRSRDRVIGIGEPVLPRYERIAFEKTLVAPPGQPPAAFVCPAHPLLDAVTDLTLERHRDLLKRGAVLVDERDDDMTPRVLFSIQHALQDGSVTRSGERRVISKRVLYVELDAGGEPSPCTTLPISTTGRWRTRSRRSTRSSNGQSAPGSAGSGTEGPGVRRCPRRSGTSQGGPRRPARAHREDRSGGEGPSHQGDLVQGQPRRAALSSTRRPARPAPGSTPARRAGGPIPCSSGCRSGCGPEAGRTDLAAAAGGARRPAGRSAGLVDTMAGRIPRSSGRRSIPGNPPRGRAPS